MAYPTDCLSAQAAVDIANRDTNRLVGQVAQYIGKRSPYTDMIDGGTLDNGSEVVRTVVSEQAVPAASMVRPVFVNASAACGTGGGIDQVGTTEFQFQLKNLRGRGPKICVKTTRTAFKSSYPAAINALKQLLLRLQNADVRANFLDNGGGKLIADSTATFAQAYAGDVNAIATAWPNRTPNARISHRALEYAMTYMRETLGVQPFDMNADGAGEVFKYVGSQDSLQNFRDELNIGLDIRALTTGRYTMGQETIQGYSFAGPYHGIMHGVDPEPLRASAVVNGVPTLVEPTIAVQTTTGYGARPNPSWVSAPYEIGFLFGQQSFKRLVPSYAKVEGWDFSNELVNGGLKFKILSDADCNLFEDYGQHLYEIERAYQPVVPHAVTAVLYARCVNSLGLTAC